MAEDFHVDMSKKIYNRETIGIACVGAESKKDIGCAVKGNLIKLIQRRLCSGDIKKDNARIYAICVYLLIKDLIPEIRELIICIDEDFASVKTYLTTLLNMEPVPFNIISISELRKKVGRDIKSLADNAARHYRRRALNRIKRETGSKLNVVEINYATIESYWKRLK